MSQVDNRNSSAVKRARTDGGRREDDWTCPSCGNVNFSFRTTCNMRNCTQPRPADHNSKFSPRPLQAPPQYASSVPYVGSGGPPSMYMSVPPYGSSVFNGASLPPYDVPYAGRSTYHYNYGSHLPGGSPHRPLHLSGPPSFTGGSVIGNGGMYGVPPLLDRYGIGLPPTGHAAMGSDPWYYPDDRPSPLPQGRNGDGTRDNDWTCPQCGNVNFSFRAVCNMRKCNTPKPEPQGLKSLKNSKPDMPEGSWKCEKCNNINYPFRTKCNRKNCGADIPSESNNKSPTEPVNESDQVCLDYTPQMTYHSTDLSITSMFYVLNVNRDPPCLNNHAVKFDLLEKLISHVKGFLPIFYQLMELDSFHNVFSFKALAFIDLELSDVPVSPRACLRFEEVQSCRSALLGLGV